MSAATIRRMLDAGLTIEQALTALEAFEAEIAEKADDKRAKKRADGAARQRAYVARKRADDANDAADANDANDANDASATSERVIGVSTTRSAYKDNRACADGNPNLLTTFGDINTPLPTVSPPKPQKSSSEAFGRFYDAYPKHTGRKAAQAKFDAAVRSGVPADRLIEAAARFAEAHRRAGTDPNFIPHPATWLNQGRYDDQDLPTARAGPPQRGGGVAFMMAETLERIAEDENRTAEIRNSKTARLLPFKPGLDCGTDDADDSGFSRPDIELLVRSAVRRM